MEKQQEFSFNIVSLHSNTNPTASASPHTTSSSSSSDRHDPKSSSSAIIDLSPADEIFFHGHLLPLHLLSHFSLLPSARSSFSSLHEDDDTFTLPSDHHYLPSAATPNTSVGDHKMNNADSRYSRAFSMFGLSRRRRVHGVIIDEEETGQKRRSSKLESAVKRCVRMMMNPSFLFRGRRRRRDIEFSPQNDSFSRNSSRRSFKLLARSRTSSYYSAPTSGMTSPTNSGLLVRRPLHPSSDSTVEELQAAVQAAIVYCKRSIEVDDKEEDENVGTIKSG